MKGVWIKEEDSDRNRFYLTEDDEEFDYDDGSVIDIIPFKTTSGYYVTENITDNSKRFNDITLEELMNKEAIRYTLDNKQREYEYLITKESDIIEYLNKYK